MKKYAIGVDLGGSNLRVGVVTKDGEVMERAKEPSNVSEGVEAVVNRLVNQLKERVRYAGKGLCGIGVAVPGVVEHASGIVASAPNLPGWKNVPLLEMLQNELNVPVEIENDSNAFALGEKWAGAGESFNSFIGITLGTGIGGGVMVDGRLVRGADGMAGEVGHMTVSLDGPHCNCGNNGCLETYSSARGIADRMREAIEAGGKSLLYKETGGNLYKINAEMVYNAAREGGDPLARNVMRKMGTYLGVGVANLVHLLNPEAVIIGGGVAAAWDIFADTVQKEVEKRCFEKPAKRVKICRGILGDDAAIIGMARVVFDAQNS
ncbi:MAG: ROK family protein [Nitrospirota bacterium]|nr:ROK family protein [Nitrospirota bacterium]